MNTSPATGVINCAVVSVLLGAAVSDAGSLEPELPPEHAVDIRKADTQAILANARRKMGLVSKTRAPSPNVVREKHRSMCMAFVALDLSGRELLTVPWPPIPHRTTSQLAYPEL